ncbi:MAG: radical SAM protein [Alphaproteobacteria bacterium]|nr:radical SAM protein [Alphaproteobacteria bacterium]
MTLDLARLRDLPAPEPVGGTAGYLAERERCLAADPRRAANHARWREAARGADTVDWLPVKLDIENVSRCNFRCSMCQVSEWDKGRRARDLTLDEFTRLLDEQYGVFEIKIQGMGEPLLQRDDYFAMIRLARARHIWVRTVTNASLLHLDDNAAKLLDSDVNEVQISIDGATAPVFESIRKGAVFDRVVSNCKLVNGLARERGRERTKMWTVMQRANWHQRDELVELAAEMLFPSMVFSLNLTDFGQEKWRERNDAVTMERQFDQEEAWRLIEKGAKLGVEVRFWNVTTKYSPEAPATLCPWPWDRLYVSSDMRVVPCCIVGNPQIADLGDAADLDGVWNGEAYRAFRRDHREGRIPSYCRQCYKNEA